jgi:hypothetical protein
MPITYQVGNPIRILSMYFLNLGAFVKNWRKLPLLTFFCPRLLNMPDSATLIRKNSSAMPSPPPMK